MRKDLKTALKYAFEAPQPVRKRAFIRKLPSTKISTTEFMLIQAAYIRKWFWLLSGFILGIALMGACFLKRDMLWTISSFLPFAALAAVAENVRSVTCNMAELEMASRFSFKSVMLARMGIIGVVHLLLLGLLLPLGHMNSAMTFVETGVFMLLPYLTATVSGLWITRRLRGREGTYACAGLAVLISGINIVVSSSVTSFYHYDYFQKSVIVLLILMALAIWEYKQFIQKTEELSWSLL